MHAKSEVIAVLLAEDDARLEQPAAMLVRDSNGQISLQIVNPDSTVAARGAYRLLPPR